MINIEDGLNLYLKLSPYLPDDAEDMSSLDYLHSIISRIKNGNPKDYIDALKIMHSIDINGLKKHSTEEILEMFVDGLKENKFFSLCNFLGSFGYGKH
jgi:hypothetical protein